MIGLPHSQTDKQRQPQLVIAISNKTTATRVEYNNYCPRMRTIDYIRKLLYTYIIIHIIFTPKAVRVSVFCIGHFEKGVDEIYIQSIYAMYLRINRLTVSCILRWPDII